MHKKCSIYTRVTFAFFQPASTITPRLQTSYLALIDGSICLPCNVHPIHYTSIIEWQKDGTVLAGNGRSELTNNGALCISNVTQNDEGNYSCHVMETFASYQLIVIGKPPILCNDSTSSMQYIYHRVGRLYK